MKKCTENSQQSAISNQSRFSLKSVNKLQFIFLFLVSLTLILGFQNCGLEMTALNMNEIESNSTQRAKFKGVVRDMSGGCGIDEFDQVSCWGYHAKIFSNGTPGTSFLPEPVVNLGKAKQVIENPARFRCALLLDNSVKCWPTTWAGPDQNPFPTEAHGLERDVARIESYGELICGILFDGSLKCSLPGYGIPGHLYSAQILQDVKQFSESCALQTNGRVTCWDWGGGVSVSNLRTIEGLSDVVQIARKCALLSDGTVKCWGQNQAPTPVVGLTDVKMIVAQGGYNHCALLINGTVKCWNYNSANPPGAGFLIPSLITGLEDVETLSAGSSNICAILSDRREKCWGSQVQFIDFEGDISKNSFKPFYLFDLVGVQQVSNNCALISDGTVKCWGRNSFVSSATPWVPLNILGLSNVKQIGRGCVLLNDGTVKTVNSTTQNLVLTQGLAGVESINEGCDLFVLSDKTVKQRTSFLTNTIVDVPGLSNVKKVTGSQHLNACALLYNKTVACWRGDSTPQEVSGLVDVEDVAGTSTYSCARLTNGTVKCWGNNDYGIFGTERPYYSAEPIQIESLNNVKDIAAGNMFMCAQLIDNTVKCWGANFYGELGAETPTIQPTPVESSLSSLSGKLVILGWPGGAGIITNGRVKMVGANNDLIPSPNLVKGPK